MKKILNILLLIIFTCLTACSFANSTYYQIESELIHLNGENSDQIYFTVSLPQIYINISPMYFKQSDKADDGIEIEFLQSYLYEDDFDFEKFVIQYYEQMMAKDFSLLYTDSFQDNKVRTITLYGDEYIHYIFIDIPSENVIISMKMRMDIEQFRHTETNSFICHIANSMIVY